jgi:hypothetical protein
MTSAGRAGEEYTTVQRAGERGDDNEKQLVHGVPEFLKKENREQYPCFLVAPQCPEGQKWVDVDWGADASLQPKGPSEPIRLVLELVDSLQKGYPIEPTAFLSGAVSLPLYRERVCCGHGQRPFPGPSRAD